MRAAKRPPPLGELAVELGMLTREDHAALAERCDPADDAAFGEALVAIGLLDLDQLEALELARSRPESLPPLLGSDFVTPLASTPAPTPLARLPLAKAAPKMVPATGPVLMVDARAYEALLDQRTSTPEVAAPPSLDLKLEVADDRAPVHALLEEAVREGPSDVHLHAEVEVLFRIDGQLETRGPVRRAAEVERLVLAILGEEDRAVLARTKYGRGVCKNARFALIGTTPTRPTSIVPQRRNAMKVGASAWTAALTRVPRRRSRGPPVSGIGYTRVGVSRASRIGTWGAILNPSGPRGPRRAPSASPGAPRTRS